MKYYKVNNRLWTTFWW